MRNSNFKPLLSLLLLATATVGGADDLSLKGDARLSGNVKSISADGVVELESALSPAALRLKPDAVQKITFENTGPAVAMPGMLVELANGDLIPGDVGTLDEKLLKVTTSDMGELGIVRSSLNSLQFGVQRQKLIYSGPKSLEEWTTDEEAARNWRFVKDGLVASGPAVAIRKIDVPERFVLRFNLKWKSNPSFIVYFADPLLTNAEKVDRYFLQFSPSGIEVKRESSHGLKIQTVILLNRGLGNFSTRQVDVELRVDRESSKIHLYLDGEPEASGVDPVDVAPTGSGFAFVSSAPTGSSQEIRDIQVLDFDDSRERHHSEERGDTKTDSMISRDDDRWSGHLASMGRQAEGTVLTFTSDFQEQPLELLENDVSTVFFAKSGEPEKPDAEDAWVLRLRGGGTLHVSSCIISDNHISTTHSLLGPLEINRAGVMALEKSAREPSAKDEE